MSKFNYLALAVAMSLAIPVQAFAQSASDQTNSNQSASQPSSNKSASGTIDHHRKAAGSATKQKAQGAITDVGPGSKAYYGNTLRPKY